jgi:protein ImuA
MSLAATKIAALRTALRTARLDVTPADDRVALGPSCVDACLQGGLARGTLHEIVAENGHETAATGFAAALCFLTAARKRVLWIRQDFSALECGEIAATGLLELGIDPARLFLLRLGNATDVLRAGLDTLSCKALGAVGLEIPGDPKILDLAASRRLTLAAAESGVSVFLLRLQAKPQASAAETRWRIRTGKSFPKNENWGSPLFEADLVRNRHGRTGHWVMEWNCDDGLFREHDATAHSGAVVSPSSHRPAAPAAQGAENIHRTRNVA